MLDKNMINMVLMQLIVEDLIVLFNIKITNNIFNFNRSISNNKY